MTLSLNLNGYVKDIHSPIYVEALAHFARPVSDPMCCVHVLHVGVLNWILHCLYS